MGLTRDTVQPQTCAVCHDPHAEGASSGEPNTGTVRITDNTPMLPAGFAAKNVGRGAICITCHNTRNGLQVADRVLIMARGRLVHDCRRDSLAIDTLRQTYEQCTGAAA